MGQYYNPMLEIEGNTTVYSTHVDGDYMMAKLMEHSWWANPFVLAVASKLWRIKGRLAWIGDYAEEGDKNWNPAFGEAYNGDASDDLVYNGFRLEGKLFLNHTKKEFVDLDKYLECMEERKQEWITNPVSLLTAVGNGKGGGDFRGSLKDFIGHWAWDELEITDEDVYNYHWNIETKEYDKSLKKEFEGFSDITEEVLFIED